MIRQALLKIGSFRYVTTAVIYFFTIDIYIRPVRDYAVTFGEKTEPAMLSFLFCSNYFLKMIMLAAIYFYSDVPFIERKDQYYYLRMGRTKFCIQNLIHIFVSSIVLSITLWGFSFLEMLPCISFENKWSRVSRTLALTDASQEIGMYFGIPYKAMEKYSPLQLCSYGVLVTVLCFTMTGTLMYALCLLIHKTMAVFLACVVVLLPNIMEQVILYSVYFSPVSWMRCDMWRYGPDIRKPDIVYIVMAYILLITVLGAICIKRSRMVEFKD